jgi:hypothetical protein
MGARHRGAFSWSASVCPGSGHRDDPVTLLGTPTQSEDTSVSSDPEGSCSP